MRHICDDLCHWVLFVKFNYYLQWYMLVFCGILAVIFVLSR